MMTETRFAAVICLIGLACSTPADTTDRAAGRENFPPSGEQAVHRPLTALAAADLARARGFWYEAEYRYAQALRGEPDHGRARFYHAWALATLRRYDEAALEYTRAAELKYNPGLAFYQAARSWARADAPDEAFASLQKAIAAGFSQFERMHREGALRSLAEDPRWAQLVPPFEAEFAVLLSAFRAGEADVAARLQALANRYPANGRAQYYAGLGLLREGRYPAAIGRLVKSADLGFETPYALYHAAEAAMQSGERKRTWALLDRCLDAGYFDWEAMTTNDVFTALHGDRRWVRIVSRLGLAAAPELDAARWVGDRRYPDARDLRLVNPDSVGLDRAILERGVDYLRASRPRTNSLIVVRHGRIAFERYFNGHGPDQATNVKSVSKAIVSAAVGAAIGDGLVDSLDAPVAEILPEYFVDINDPRKRRITLRHLLTMTSGLPFDEGGSAIRDWLRSEDWVEAYLGQQLVAEPGRVWKYATASTHLLGTAVARAAGEPLGGYINRRLFAPIGITSAEWSVDPQGNTFAGSDLRITPRDMARFGLLMLDRGRWGEQRILPESWVIESTAPQVGDESDELDLQDYGFAWWSWTPGRYRSFLAAGHGGNYINVTPELDLVVVTTGDVHRPATPPISSFIKGFVFRAVSRKAR